MPDVQAKEFAMRAVQNNEDVHVANLVVFDWIRAVLFRIPLAEHPDVEWFIDGKSVTFNDHLRSNDAWSTMTDIHADALEILLSSPISFCNLLPNSQERETSEVIRRSCEEVHEDIVKMISEKGKVVK